MATSDIELQNVAPMRAFAPIETTNIASRDYKIGEYYLYTLNNILYEVTQQVTAGDTLRNGTNVRQSSVADGLARSRGYQLGNGKTLTITPTYASTVTILATVQGAGTNAAFLLVGYFANQANFHTIIELGNQASSGITADTDVTTFNIHNNHARYECSVALTTLYNNKGYTVTIT